MIPKKNFIETSSIYVGLVAGIISLINERATIWNWFSYLAWLVGIATLVFSIVVLLIGALLMGVGFIFDSCGYKPPKYKEIIDGGWADEKYYDICESKNAIVFLVLLATVGILIGIFFPISKKYFEKF